MAQVLPTPEVFVTADEARVRECPMIRTTVQYGDRALDEHVNCRGPDCLGWRWGYGARKRFFVTLPGKPEEEWAWNPIGSDRERYADAKVREVVEPARGFCGYAGKGE